MIDGGTGNSISVGCAASKTWTHSQLVGGDTESDTPHAARHVDNDIQRATTVSDCQHMDEAKCADRADYQKESK